MDLIMTKEEMKVVKHDAINKRLIKHAVGNSKMKILTHNITKYLADR